MQGWMRSIAALAMAVFVLDSAAADTEKGTRGGASTSQPSVEDTNQPSVDNQTDADAPVEPLSVEGWEGGAYYNESKNEYYCEVGDDYGDGTTIWFGWGAAGLYMMIDDPNTFDLEEFADVGATIAIDDFYRQDFQAFSSGKSELDFIFGRDPASLEAFGKGENDKGEKMTVYPWDHWYTLLGVAKAIPALEDCYKRHS